VTGLLFAVAAFFSPIIAMVGGGYRVPNAAHYSQLVGAGFRAPADVLPPAGMGDAFVYPITAGALIFVGFLMMNAIRNIEWDDWEESFPAFLTFVCIPLTYSISNGIGLGFISHTLIKLLRGKARQVHGLMVAVGVEPPVGQPTRQGSPQALLASLFPPHALALQAVAPVLLGFSLAFVARSTPLLGFTLMLVARTLALLLGTLLFQDFTFLDLALLHKFGTPTFLGLALAFLSLASVLLPRPATFLPCAHSFLPLATVLDAFSFSHFLRASRLGENRGSDEPTEDDQGQGFQMAVHGALLVKGGLFSFLRGYRVNCSRSAGRRERIIETSTTSCRCLFMSGEPGSFGR